MQQRNIGFSSTDPKRQASSATPFLWLGTKSKNTYSCLTFEYPKSHSLMSGRAVLTSSVFSSFTSLFATHCGTPDSLTMLSEGDSA